MVEDPLVLAAALAGLVLSAVAIGLAWAAESRSRRTDRRLEMMDTPNVQATFIDAKYWPEGDTTRVMVRARVLNPGFVEDTIRGPRFMSQDFGEGLLEAFGRPIGDHGEDLDENRTIGSPEDSTFDFIFSYATPLSLDARKGELRLSFLRNPEIIVGVRFGP